MNRDELATVTGRGDYRRIEVRRVIRAPIEKVWSAITNADHVRHWWTAGVIDAREGGGIRLGGEEAPGDGLFPLDGEIKVFEPPRIFEFTWNESYDPAQGLVRLDLVELDEGSTQVTLIHTVPSIHGALATAGWHQLVERLGYFVETGAPPADDGDRFRELATMYETRVAS
jgi:uncharacterized protein YndB with AHSA1/START domain